jgi:hypothetical protein
MYGKIFEDIFKSSLIAEGGWLPTYIFMSMVAMADKDGRFREDPRNFYEGLKLHRENGVSFEAFSDALDFLEKPDNLSNLDVLDGRRIVSLTKLAEIEGNRGWVIVNYKHYRDKGGSLEARREADTDRKRKQRERQKKEPIKPHRTVTGRHVTSTHTDTDTDTDTDTKAVVQNSAEFDQMWDMYPKKVKKKVAEKAFNRLSNTDRSNLLAHLPDRITDDPAFENRQFIPDPPTFINQRRWEDEDWKPIAESPSTPHVSELEL